MRPALAAAAAWILLAACDESKKPPIPSAPSAAPAASNLEELGIDAAAIPELSVDPPAPAGDLKTELERFVSLDACVAERKNLDPLVADALRGIGYDTFLRDACRLLEATKDRKRETCERVDSSALRARCQSWVAIVSQTPDACPMQYDGVPARGRNPSCVAIAGRDPRLCVSEGRAGPRVTCEALAFHDEARCDQLVAHERPSCRREVARWRSLLSEPLEGLPKLSPPSAKLVVRGDGPTPDPATPETDLSVDFVRGAVVVTLRDRARVELGSVAESEAARFAPSPQKRPRAGVAVVLEPPALGAKEPKPALQKLEVEIPGEATLVYPGAKCDCKLTKTRIDRARGGEVSIALEGTISLGTRAYKLSLAITTFVRDVVAEQAGSKALPVIHPVIGAGPKDGGT